MQTQEPGLLPDIEDHLTVGISHTLSATRSPHSIIVRTNLVRHLQMVNSYVKAHPIIIRPHAVVAPLQAVEMQIFQCLSSLGMNMEEKWG